MKIISLKKILTYKIAAPVKKIGAFLLSRSNLSAWAKLYTGHRLKVDLSSSVGRSIYLRGIYEQEVETYIKLVLKPGDVFVDVGANVGYFSIIAREIVGEQGEIHCFEPYHKISKLLQSSVADNSFNNIYVNSIALWNTSGKITFAPQPNSAFSYLVPNATDSANIITETVPVIDFDEYAASSVKKRVCLVKIDAEGAEYQILLGMKKTISESYPIFILEVQDWSLSKFGNSINEIFSFFGSYGYKSFDLFGKPIINAEHAVEVLKKLKVKNLVFEPVKN